jgi:drug/metabolite transporter (DMT)-like permease
MRKLLLSPLGVAAVVILYLGLILGLLLFSGDKESARALVGVLVGLTGGVPFGYAMAKTRPLPQWRDLQDVPVWTGGRIIATALLVLGFLAFIGMTIVLAIYITPP